jgi:hypothetical protein
VNAPWIARVVVETRVVRAHEISGPVRVHGALFPRQGIAIRHETLVAEQAAVHAQDAIRR